MAADVCALCLETWHWAEMSGGREGKKIERGGGKEDGRREGRTGGGKKGWEEGRVVGVFVVWEEVEGGKEPGETEMGGGCVWEWVKGGWEDGVWEWVKGGWESEGGVEVVVMDEAGGENQEEEAIHEICVACPHYTCDLHTHPSEIYNASMAK